MDFGVYQHHGLAIGPDEVIHFGRGIFDIENAIVEVVDVETFSKGSPVSVVESPKLFSNEEVLARARERLGETGYDLFENNCEHFVRWCRSDVSESPQINRAETVVRQAAAVCAKPFLKKIAQKAIGKQAVRGLGVSVIARTPTIVATVADAIQTTTELVAARNGQTKESARTTGQQVGAASSVAIGWAVGGPVTAAAGVGIWLAGQFVADRAISRVKEIV